MWHDKQVRWSILVRYIYIYFTAGVQLFTFDISLMFSTSVLQCFNSSEASKARLNEKGRRRRGLNEWILILTSQSTLCSISLHWYYIHMEVDIGEFKCEDNRVLVMFVQVPISDEKQNERHYISLRHELHQQQLKLNFLS